MTRGDLFRAIAGIDDCFIAEAIRYDPPSASGSSERIVHLNKKKIISFALAAVLMLSLGIAAYATYNAISTPQAAEKVAQEQLARWRELGILPPDAIFEGEADQIVEIEGYPGGAAWYGRFFPHSFDVRWYSGERKYRCNVNIDTLDGKILYANFYAFPDEDAIPTGEIELTVGPDGETKTFYYYDNFDDLFGASQTVDDFCSALAAYWGFDGYRLADEGDPIYTEEYVSCFGAVDGSTRLLDVPWDNSGHNFLAVFFDGDAEQAPMYLDLMQYPGYIGMDVGIHHPVG